MKNLLSCWSSWLINTTCQCYTTIEVGTGLVLLASCLKIHSDFLCCFSLFSTS